MSRLFLPLAAAIACSAAPARSAETASAAAEAEPIFVTGAQATYGAAATTTATKTTTGVKNIPQAITTITAAQIQDQQLRSVGDLLLFVPGASYGSGEGNRDQLVLRGNSSTADFFADGVRDDVQYFRDLYNVERVEVLKGPNAMIFGRGGGGGVVNRVIKRPAFSETNQFDASTDNWGAMRFAADLDHTLSNQLAARLNGVYENSTAFRRHDRLNRYGINPTVALRTTAGTRIDLSFEHFHDRRTADRGVPANGDEPLRGFTRTFFGDPDISFSRADVDVATIAVEHRFGERLKLRSRSQFGDYRKFYQNVFPNSFNRVTNLVALSGYNNLNNRTSLFNQTDVVWDAKLGGIEQTLLFGFEAGDEKSRNKHLTASFLAGAFVPLSDPTVDSEVVFAPGASDADNRVQLTDLALYAQDQIRPAAWLEIIAGIRLETLHIAVNDLRAALGGQFGRRDELVSPRLGFVLKPAEYASFYASYSRSYLPQSGDQFSSLTSITEGLKPERFDNYEVGAKVELPGGLLATLAAYRLTRTNTRATDPNDPSVTVLTGAQRSKGLELGLERRIAGNWLIAGGYALQKATITSATTAAPAGRQVPLVPRHSLSLWNRYQVTSELGVGLGLIARSKSYATISNAVKLPGYSRVDAALFYKSRRGIALQLNAENLLGAHYFPTANADNNIMPGAPRSIRATIGYGF